MQSLYVCHLCHQYSFIDNHDHDDDQDDDHLNVESSIAKVQWQQKVLSLTSQFEIFWKYSQTCTILIYQLVSSNARVSFNTLSSQITSCTALIFTHAVQRSCDIHKPDFNHDHNHEHFSCTLKSHYYL